MIRKLLGKTGACLVLGLFAGVCAHAQTSYPTMSVSASASSVAVGQPVTFTVSFTCCIANFGASLSCPVYDGSDNVVDYLGISPYGGSTSWTPTAAGTYTAECQCRGYAEYSGTDIPYSLYGSSGGISVS